MSSPLFGATLRDSAETWFYLDPPYVHFQANGRYEALSEDRREELFATLTKLSGSFLMSFDDCEEVRELVKRHRLHLRPVAVNYTLCPPKQASEKFREVLIANREIKLAA